MAENDGLHAQLLTQAREAGVLDERQRMAREIHDTIAQGLTGVITQLEAAGNVKDPAELGRHLDNATRLARESLTEARRSVQGIPPMPLEKTRLPEAIADVATRWSGVNEVPVQLTTTGNVEGPPSRNRSGSAARRAGSPCQRGQACPGFTSGSDAVVHG